jgi:hypothetical protein
LGHTEAASAAYREALALCRRVLEEYVVSLQARLDIALSLSRTAWIHYLEGDGAGACADGHEALAIFKSLAEQYWDVPGYRENVTRTEVILKKIGCGEVPATP